MNLDLQQIVEKGEGVSVEFKSKFNIETIETLVAFANSKGGVVYIGINNSGQIIGVSLAQESVQQWVNEIKCKTAPSLMPDVDIIEVDEKKIVAIGNWNIHSSPFQFKAGTIKG